jgi:cytochrome c oxidase subunit II
MHMNFPIFPSLLADEAETFWFPKQASTVAADVDWMYDAIMVICTLFFVGIVGCLFWFAYKYRGPKGAPALSRVRHHTALEVFWSVAPCFLLAWIFYEGAVGYLRVHEPPKVEMMEVKVQAQKWVWGFTYPGNINSPELHCVKGKPVLLTMKSVDVLHSLYIPAFRVKQDVVPGRYTSMWFEATMSTPGDEYFDLYCTEYCGKDHSMMQTKVVVHETQAEFDAWLVEAEKPKPGQSPEDYGRGIYEQKGCKGCHTIDGGAGTGPSFKGLFGRQEMFADGTSTLVDENYIQESIYDPAKRVVKGFNPVMPSYKGQLKDFQIEGLIAFLKSLK